MAPKLMKAAFAGLLACTAPIAIAAEKDLKVELAKTQAALEKCRSQKSSFSVVDAAGHAYGVGQDMVEHLLSKTTADEQFVEVFSNGVAKAKDVTAQIKSKVSSVDYARYVKDLQSHEMYTTAHRKLKPILDEHVHPALEKASVHLAPAMQTVQDALPKLKQAGNEAYEKLTQEAPKKIEEAHTVFGRLVDPLFKTIGKIAPSYADQLPVSTMDRIVFVLVTVFVTYHLFWLGLWLLRFNFKVGQFCLKILASILYFFVLLPFKILRKVVGLFLWVATGFYCCGMCRKKAKVTETNGKSKNGTTAANSKNGKANEVSSKVDTVSIDDLKKLLDDGKKEKKLDAAVKQLAALVKSGKAMTTPKHLAGKIVTKDALSKAVGKFKELDPTKFNL